MPTRLAIVSVVIVLLFSMNAIANDSATVLIADFGSSALTQQGGFFQCVGGRPDEIVDQLVTLGQPEESAWRISITDKATEDSVGALIPLFDETGGSKTPLEIVAGSFLRGSFLGKLGNRRLRIELLTKPNSEAAGVQLGTIESDQLDAQTWKDIRLPIDGNEGSTKKGYFLRIYAEGNGPAWFAINSIAFTSGTPRPIASKPVASHSLRKALWFWETERTLPDDSGTHSLLELCQDQGITDLYCQIPYSYENGKVQIRLADELANLNAAAAALGVTTHALDGQADYVFQRNHPRMIRLLDALAKFNEQRALNEQFQAVHLDNEPYVLPGWQNDEERQKIIQDYITLNQKLRRQADAAGMEFGVDIPFWWDVRNRDGSFKFTYETGNDKQPILEALFPLVHNVGIMSYRDRATGPNGTVAHCFYEFSLGERLGIDVFASVELGVGPAVEPNTTYGVYPWAYFRGQLSTLETILSHTPGCAGLAIHYAKPFAEAMK